MTSRLRFWHAALAAAPLFVLAPSAQADAILDWNLRSAQIVGEARIGTPPAVRVMALVQTAALEAAQEAARQSPGQPMAVEAAVAGAHRVALGQLLPAQKAAVEAAFQAALSAQPEGARRSEQAAVGERAAQRVLATRADDLPRAADTYRPHATPGRYVPTVLPAATAWPQRRPWLLDRADQFRPPPPPALDSERWTRDLHEVRMLGGRDSKARTADQTETARFWDYSLPAIYHGVVRSVAQQPGRDLLANARLFASVAQAMDDALIAVFDAKYTYQRWRPLTAIRNADNDGFNAAEREEGWLPLIETPLHPEYPCAHCILAGTVARLLEAEGQAQPLPVLATASPTAQGALRRWTSPSAFAQEVAAARILGGVHFRHSTEVGLEMGRRIGEWALARRAAETRPD